MEYRNLGLSGLRVSLLGLGCNNFGGRIDLDASRTVVDRAIGLGVTLFDTADVYGERGGSETVLGEVLGERRRDVVLATKFGIPMDDGGQRQGASRRYIMEAVEASLRRLKTDWIDLYQLHRPDQRTPIEETLRALTDLIRQGKVRYVGCSNLPAWQVVDADWTADEDKLENFICCQDEYSLVARGAETDLLPALESRGLGLLPYFPLASGLLTGKYSAKSAPPPGSRLANRAALAERYLTPARLALAGRFEAFARERGHTLLELALCWLAAQPAVGSIIAGATRPEQVAQNAAALGWRLTAEELAAVDGICAGA